MSKCLTPSVAATINPSVSCFVDLLDFFDGKNFFLPPHILTLNVLVKLSQFKAVKVAVNNNSRIGKTEIIPRGIKSASPKTLPCAKFGTG